MRGGVSRACRVLLVDDDVRELERARAHGIQTYAAPRTGNEGYGEGGAFRGSRAGLWVGRPAWFGAGLPHVLGQAPVAVVGIGRRGEDAESCGIHHVIRACQVLDSFHMVSGSLRAVWVDAWDQTGFVLSGQGQGPGVGWTGTRPKCCAWRARACIGHPWGHNVRAAGGLQEEDFDAIFAHLGLQVPGLARARDARPGLRPLPFPAEPARPTRDSVR